MSRPLAMCPTCARPVRTTTDARIRAHHPAGAFTGRCQGAAADTRTWRTSTFGDRTVLVPPA